MPLLYHGTPHLYPVLSSHPTSAGHSGAGLSSPVASVPASAEPGPSRRSLPTVTTAPDPTTPHDTRPSLPIASDPLPPLPERMMAVRFAEPVSIESVVIVPAGVECPSGSGQTSPDTFTADIYLNVVGATPPNALAHTTLVVDRSDHALSFTLGMGSASTSTATSASDTASTGPASVPTARSSPARTRLLILRARAEKITLSIYGHSASTASDSATVSTTLVTDMASVTPHGLQVDPNNPGATSNGVKPPLPPLSLPPVQDTLNLLSDPSASPSLRRRAILALGLAAQTTLTVASLATHNVTPLESLDPADLVSLFDQVLGISLTNDDAHPLLMALVTLHAGAPAVSDTVSTTDTTATVDALLQSPATARPRSRLSSLLDLCSALSTCSHPLAATNLAHVVSLLSKLQPSFPHPESGVLARALSPLAVVALTAANDPSTPLTTGSARPQTSLNPYSLLPLDPSFAHEIITALFLASTQVVRGRSTLSASKTLAAPFLPYLQASDPLRLAFDPSAQASTPATSFAPSSPLSPPAARLLQALSSLPSTLISTSLPPSTSTPTPYPSSVIHALTPPEIISAIAPSLFTTLSTAPHPPLGIPASAVGPRAGAQASDWGGKVYSRDEFRRDREAGVGLGGGVAGVGTGSGMVTTTSAGLTATSSGSSAMGLGMVGISSGPVGMVDTGSGIVPVVSPTILGPGGVIQSGQGVPGAYGIGMGYASGPSVVGGTRAVSETASTGTGVAGAGVGGRKASRHVDEF